MRSVWCNPCEQRITNNDDVLIAHARRHGTVIMWSVNGGDFIGDPQAFAPITSDEVIDLTDIVDDVWTGALRDVVAGQALQS